MMPSKRDWRIFATAIGVYVAVGVLAWYYPSVEPLYPWARAMAVLSVLWYAARVWKAKSARRQNPTAKARRDNDLASAGRDRTGL